MSKTALITGASSGIGSATAYELSKHGFLVILTSRNKDKLEKVRQSIVENGGEAKIIISDLSNVNAINKLINQIKRSFKKIDLIVNVAGIWHGENESYSDKKFSDFKQQIILETFSVGIIAPSLVAHGLVSIMPAGSQIINISGTFESGAKGWLPYYLSKRALEDLTVGLAEELEELKIQVNCISPSDVSTEAYRKYFPEFTEDALEPEDIARFVIHLITASYSTGKVWVLKKDQKPIEKFHT